MQLEVFKCKDSPHILFASIYYEFSFTCESEKNCNQRNIQNQVITLFLFILPANKM